MAGSVDLAPDYAADEDIVASVAAALLDKGTRTRDRFAVATVLEERGARVAYSMGVTRLEFSARCLARDVEAVVDAMIEPLCAPLFDPDELVKVVRRMRGALARAATDPAELAASALARRLFPPDHPGYVRTPADEEELLVAVDRDGVAEYHARSFRGRRVRFAAAGDVPVERMLAALGQAFASWTAGGECGREYRDPGPVVPGYDRIPVADRPNLEVRLGHTVSLRRADPDFEPLVLALFALGGNFSSRLMSRIRDEQGLTYGIHSSLRGIDVAHGGSWRTAVTLSADRLDEGLDATRSELERFVRDGLTESEVRGAAETLAGQHAVALATTHDVADRLLTALERGEPVERIDGYPGRMRAMDRDRVNAAIGTWLDPGALSTAVAGTLVRTGI